MRFLIPPRHLYSSFQKNFLALFFLLFIFALPALEAQTISLDDAVQAAGLDLVKNMEKGSDIGWISETKNAVYYSIYPFAHYSLFRPIGNNSGWYIGAGGGWEN